MKIRIMGTPRECDDAVKVLRLGFDVLEVSFGTEGLATCGACNGSGKCSDCRGSGKS